MVEDGTCFSKARRENARMMIHGSPAVGPWRCVALTWLLAAAACGADEYRVIMWVGDSAHKQADQFPLFIQRLRDMGVNTGMVTGDADPQRWLDARFPYYVENIVNRGLCLKWSSKVRDWSGFIDGWKQARDPAAFVREYGLDDPPWREYARNAMRHAARRHRDHAPFAYNIRDELSITQSANPFDYDFAPASLQRFRAWLQTQYGDLAALNRQWETGFATWDEVRPFSTDEIKNRMASGDALPRGKPDWPALRRLKFDPATARQAPTRWNFSPWCDFRTYMDSALAGVLDDCRRAAHEIDPHTPVGIEGTQMPSAFGGYDLWRLAQVLDWVEPYDVACARTIFGSFMPGKPILTTVGETDPLKARRRLWHLLLEGDRGCIIWWSEDCIDWKSADLALTPKARALAPVLKELTGPLARLFLHAQREFDPIAIHYSQPSIQVDWLLESIPDGATWVRRFSSYEAQHNRMARDRVRCLQMLRDDGYSPRFVATAQIENGELTRRGYQALLMPGSLAVTDAEAAQIRAFGKAYSDEPVGCFDGHGKLRQDGLTVSKGTVRLPRDITVTTSNAHTAIYRYRLGSTRLVAFERNASYRMGEDLKQAAGNEALEKPVEIEAALARPAHVLDLRTGQYLGQTERLRFTLDPWQPSLFALSPEKLSVRTLLKP